MIDVNWCILKFQCRIQRFFGHHVLLWLLSTWFSITRSPPPPMVGAEGRKFWNFNMLEHLKWYFPSKFLRQNFNDKSQVTLIFMLTNFRHFLGTFFGRPWRFNAMKNPLDSPLVNAKNLWKNEHLSRLNFRVKFFNYDLFVSHLSFISY